jgi:hypothetical protein
MFKNKCYIRKNNKFLRETLKKLGYVEVAPNDKDVIIVTNDGHDTSYYTTINEESIKNLICTFVDCGKSETLFLAIAAMTDEHDKFQFFTTLANQSWVNQGMYSPKGSLEFCMVTDRYFGQNPLTCNSIVPAEKSTIDELIKEFKDKEEDTQYYSKVPKERWKRNSDDFPKRYFSFIDF